MKPKLICLLGLGVYCILSVVDYVFTFALIHLSGGTAYESNPVAAACLERHGWNGLAAFKVGGVCVFVVAVGLLASRRPQIAAGVAALGCAVLLTVTTYSHRLIVETRAEIATRDAGWGPPPRDPLREPYMGLFAAR